MAEQLQTLDSFFASWMGLVYFVTIVIAELFWWVSLQRKPRRRIQTTASFFLIISVLAGMTVDHPWAALLAALASTAVFIGTWWQRHHAQAHSS